MQQRERDCNIGLDSSVGRSSAVHDNLEIFGSSPALAIFSLYYTKLVNTLFQTTFIAAAVFPCVQFLFVSSREYKTIPSSCKCSARWWIRPEKKGTLFYLAMIILFLMFFLSFANISGYKKFKDKCDRRVCVFKEIKLTLQISHRYVPLINLTQWF